MGDLSQFPSGTVTFLFTDIEGSTKLAQEHPVEMPELLARHNAILNQAIEKYHGFVFRIVGDSYSLRRKVFLLLCHINSRFCQDDIHLQNRIRLMNRKHFSLRIVLVFWQTPKDCVTEF